MGLIAALVVVFWEVPATATPLCAAGDSLSTPFGWIYQLPPNIDVTSVGAVGTPSRVWVPTHSSGRFSTLVDCAEMGGRVASINLGTNDIFIYDVTVEEYFDNAVLILNALAPHFEQVVWIYTMPYVEIEVLYAAVDWLYCISQHDLLEIEDYSGGRDFQCCHPNIQGQKKLAAEYVRLVPEPSLFALSISALLTLGVVRLGQSVRLTHPRS